MIRSPPSATIRNTVQVCKNDVGRYSSDLDAARLTFIQSAKESVKHFFKAPIKASVTGFA